MHCAAISRPSSTNAWNGPLDDSIATVHSASDDPDPISKQTLNSCRRGAPFEERPQRRVVHPPQIPRHVVVEDESLGEGADEQIASAVIEVA